jgi:hypothetical protein
MVKLRRSITNNISQKRTVGFQAQFGIDDLALDIPSLLLAILQVFYWFDPSIMGLRLVTFGSAVLSYSPGSNNQAGHLDLSVFRGV